MAIIKNSAKCVDCGEEIESKSGHHFVVHYCEVAPLPGPDGKPTWNFAVDGGKNYLRRCGSGYIDTSEVTE